LRRNGRNGLGHYFHRAPIGVDDLCGTARVHDDGIARIGFRRAIDHAVALPPIDQDLTLQNLHGNSEGVRAHRRAIEERNKG
jgi:hypothetical protein